MVDVQLRHIDWAWILCNMWRHSGLTEFYSALDRSLSHGFCSWVFAAIILLEMFCGFLCPACKDGKIRIANVKGFIQSCGILPSCISKLCNFFITDFLYPNQVYHDLSFHMSDPAVQALMKSLCFLNSLMQKLLQHVNLSGSECRVDVGCWECTIGCSSMHGGTTVQHQIYHCCKLHFSLWSGGFCSSCWVLLFGHYHSHKCSSKGTTWKDLLPKRTVRELGYKGHLHVENCEVVWWGRERAH